MQIENIEDIRKDLPEGQFIILHKKNGELLGVRTENEDELREVIKIHLMTI